MKRMTYFWILAVIITLVAAIYQRKTGPTYPKSYVANFSGKDFKGKMPRSEGEKDCKIELNIPDKNIEATIFYKKLNVNEDYTPVTLNREGDKLVGFLPQQPPAGKLQYYVQIYNSNDKVSIFEKENIVIRFKGDVPPWVLIPHIFFMFFAMMISTLAGLLAVFKNKNYLIYSKIAFWLLLIGGMILGPIVQKYAFGEFWTGIPFGFDLTDNKTLIAFIFWLLAFVLNLKKERPVWVWIAALVLLMIFTIPHSMFGSELNYETGTVTQGFVLLVPFLSDWKAFRRHENKL